jgi:integrase
MPPYNHTPTWSRKPDGRPFVNVVIHGKRQRISLLTQEHVRHRNLAPPDAECQRLFEHFVRVTLPRLQGAAPDCNDIQALFDWYVETILEAKAAAKASIWSYRYRLGEIAQFLRKRGVSTVQELAAKPDRVNDYIRHRRKDAKPRTIKTELAMWKAAFRAAKRLKVIDVEPISDWPAVRAPRPAYEDFDVKDAILKMLDRLRGRPCYNAARFVAFQGCRPSVACALRRNEVHDLDTDKPYISLVDPKTNERHLMPLSPGAAGVIREELARGVQTLYLFTDKTGAPFRPARLSDAMHDHGKRFGVSAKTCRQYIVSRLYDAGCDDAKVKRVTGHASAAVRTYRHLRRDAGYSEIATATADLLNKEQNGHP